MKMVTTNDGIRLNLIDEGKGEAIILLHGWSQTAEMFRGQIDFLKKHFRVIAYDMRGHGLSDKPDFGYRISRLAKDLFDVTQQLKLKKFILLGHSMGCSVIWSFIDLFGENNISKLIFVDQQMFMTINPLWDDVYKEKIGGSVPHDQLINVMNAFSGEKGVEISKNFIQGRFSDDFSKHQLDWIIAENLKMPREYAGKLLFNHLTQDWRDIVPKIKVKSLIITGLSSDKPLKCQEYLCEQLGNAHLVVFSKEEKGSHFMFFENPQKFNQVVFDFLQ